MMKGIGMRRKPTRLKKLESQKLHEENLLFEKKIQKMSKFVEKEKEKDKIRKQQKPVKKKKAIRGYATKLIKKHQKVGGVKFKKRGLRAYDEIIKKKMALKNQGGESGVKLKNFLKANNLLEYADEFKKEGVESIEKLLDFDIKKIGMKPGHEIKLKKRIEALKRIKNDRSQVKIGTQGKLQDILERKKSARAVNESVEGRRPKKNLKGASSKFIKKKKISIVQKKQMVSCGTGTGNSDLNSKKVKKSCWLCCKVFQEEEGISHPLLDNKDFCSKNCLKKEFSNISSQCATCNRIVMKTQGILKGQSWFCSEPCMNQFEVKEEEQEPEVEEMVIEAEDYFAEDEVGLEEVDLDMDFDF